MALMYGSGYDNDAYCQEHTEVKQQLQKSFSVLKQCLHTWKDAHSASAASLQSITNLTEQCQCCMRVPDHELPCRDQLPDIKERLLYKIANEIDKKFDVFRKFVDKMRYCCERMEKQYDHCMAHYTRTCDEEDLSTVTVATACYPSVSDMLEWIEISERLLRISFLCKEHQIVSYLPDKEGITDSWHTAWQDTACINQIEGYLARTQFFLEADLT